MIFKRKIYNKILQWKKDRDGSSALLIEGARRIGKSTIAEEFARNEYESYILIDFSKASKEVYDLFEDISDLDYIFIRLQLLYQTTLHPRKSVIIFDEIQKAPKARQAIKHLVKDHRYDYIETGSLISIHKSSADILIPSEETRFEMFPMDYEEFRWALGDEATIPLLHQLFVSKTKLGDQTHRKMMRDFRLYMAVGGMPQAVNAYIETKDLRAVDLVKRDIITLYEEDFYKIDPSGKTTALYAAIPSQLSRNVSRFYSSEILPYDDKEKISDLVAVMNKSMAVNVAYRSNDPNVGLALTKDPYNYKMYASDTGLFVTLCFKDRDFTDNIIYEKILADKLPANLGYVFENVVAQMLRATGLNLYYCTVPTHEGKKFYEIDFVIPQHHKISPIEVKSSGYMTHKSLDLFCDKYSSRIENKYVIYTKDLNFKNGIFYLPVYMTMFL